MKRLLLVVILFLVCVAPAGAQPAVAEADFSIDVYILDAAIIVPMTPVRLGYASVWAQSPLILIPQRGAALVAIVNDGAIPLHYVIETTDAIRADPASGVIWPFQKWPTRILVSIQGEPTPGYAGTLRIRFAPLRF